MRRSSAVIWLSWLVLVLGVAAAGIGLFLHDEGPVYAFTSLRGQAVQIYGQGLYRYDSFLLAAGNRGSDAVTLTFEAPLLLLSIVLYRRRSLKGALLLTGSLGYFLYYYASMALGAAYNVLFLLYVILFSASFFAFVLALGSVDASSLAACFSSRSLRRGVAVYLFTVGLVLVAVWLPLIIGPLVRGDHPTVLGSYTTMITWALDLGIISPAAFMAGIQLLRRHPMGYLLATVIVLLNLTIGAALIGQGAAQLWLHVPVTLGEVLGMMVSFAILTITATFITVVLFRRLIRPPSDLTGRPERVRCARPAHRLVRWHSRARERCPAIDERGFSRALDH